MWPSRLKESPVERVLESAEHIQERAGLRDVVEGHRGRRREERVEASRRLRLDALGLQRADRAEPDGGGQHTARVACRYAASEPSTRSAAKIAPKTGAWCVGPWYAASPGRSQMFVAARSIARPCARDARLPTWLVSVASHRRRSAPSCAPCAAIRTKGREARAACSRVSSKKRGMVTPGRRAKAASSPAEWAKPPAGKAAWPAATGATARSSEHRVEPGERDASGRFGCEEHAVGEDLVRLGIDAHGGRSVVQAHVSLREPAAALDGLDPFAQPQARDRALARRAGRDEGERACARRAPQSRRTSGA